MKKYDKVILLSDMDGTLLNSESKVSKENQEAIKDFMEQGGKFGIATGRSRFNSLSIMEGVKVNIPCILLNGSAVYDFNTQEYVSVSELPKDKLLKFLEFIQKEYPKVAIQIYCPNMCYFVSIKEFADEHICSIHQPNVFSQLNDIIDIPWIKILFYGAMEVLELLNTYLIDFELGHVVDRVFSGPNYFEILPEGANKGNAMLKLREKMPGEYKIYAVGDYNNDIEMIKAADVGIATENSNSALKEVADIITVSNDESVIADIIYRIM